MALTPEVREQLLEVVPHADCGDSERAWETAAGLLARWREDVDAAAGLALLVGHRRLSRTRRLALAQQLLLVHGGAVEVLHGLGSAADGLWGQSYLNAACPSEPLFLDIVTAIEGALDGALLEDDRARLAEVLAGAAAVAGRRCDAVAEAAHRSLLERRRRQRWEDWYNYGLFLKTRGRWDDSLSANRRAVQLGGGGDDSVRWNLGISATAAGQGEVALQVWRDLEQEVELGEDGLPTGPYDPVQVRLAERPLAERGELDSPGHEEAVWVERRSPCHGVVRSEPVAPVGVHFGDVVLFDGTPLYRRPWNGHPVPVFGHLATLRAGGYRTYPMGGVEGERRQISRLAHGERDTIVPCVHREQVQRVCRGCLDPGRPHESVEALVVEGVLCVGPDQDLSDVERLLAEGLAALNDPLVRIVVPELHADLGDVERQAELSALLVRLHQGCPQASAQG